jgi:hypothetical protein
LRPLPALALQEFSTWALEAGFVRTEAIQLLGPTSAAVAYK